MVTAGVSQKLICFDAVPRIDDLQLEVTLTRLVPKEEGSCRLRFSFQMKSHHPDSFERLRLPELKTEPRRERRDELWKHTCFELFFAPVGESSYLEFNLSPSGDWNAYQFNSYRMGMKKADHVMIPTLIHATAEAGAQLWWQGELVLHQLKAQVLVPTLVVGASAVLEYQDGRQEYWALKHAGLKPDFHLRESFLLHLA